MANAMCLLQDLCRLCLDVSGTHNIFDEGNDKLIQDIFQCTGIEQISYNDELPRTICGSCRFRLKVAKDLREYATRNDLFMRSIIDNKDNDYEVARPRILFKPMEETLSSSTENEDRSETVTEMEKSNDVDCLVQNKNISSIIENGNKYSIIENMEQNDVDHSTYIKQLVSPEMSMKQNHVNKVKSAAIEKQAQTSSKVKRSGKYGIKCEICEMYVEIKKNVRRAFMAHFPSDEYRCKQWVQATGNEDLAYVPIESLYHKFVCEKHFTKKCFNRKKNRLKRIAVPTENLCKDPLTDEVLLDFPFHRVPSIKPTSALRLHGDHDYVSLKDILKGSQ